ncbi:membrane protein [Streptomyces sp. NRRL S-444]|nr:membrane protein [Streptomyces sp. NRRL S-444]
MTSRTPYDSNSPQARIAEMRRAERARDRRNAAIAITVSVAVAAGLIGFGAWVLIDKQQKEDAKVAALKAPVNGEQTWDAKALGRNHVETPVKYPMNPPVGGDHSPRWMNCNGDVYKNPVPEVNAVHSLEHGAVWVTYNEKAAKGDVDSLAGTVAKTPYTLMSPVKEQAGTIMLSAWGKQLTVDKADDPRVAQFFTKYVQGPQTPEPGAACTSGLAEK